MMFPNYWGSWDWIGSVAILLAVAVAVILWSYARARGSLWLKLSLGLVKFIAIGLLVVCLLEPMNRLSRPEPGANLMLVLADDSQSLQIKDRGASESREFALQRLLNKDSNWLDNLAGDFDVRRYQFDRQLRPVANFEAYQADQRGSDLIGNLKLASERLSGRPVAGIVVLTDGNMTDTGLLESKWDNIDWSKLPPVYPIVIGQLEPADDLGITRVWSSQTNFESAPVTITAELIAHGFSGKSIVVQLLDSANQELDRQTVRRVEEGRTFAVRFNTQPKRRGVNVYRIRTFLESDESLATVGKSVLEATNVNNERIVIVNRGRGPYRVLYVTGRPNWELKFLRRAMAADDEISLVALVRIARREAKFSFRGRSGQESNPLYRGFANQDDDTAEQHDEPVFLRLGTQDQDELRNGFPQDAETLFRYDAVVLDDVEANFFTEDQKSLLKKFISLRGGGLLMLGGLESFAAGGYRQTTIGELLPIYLDDRIIETASQPYQLNLTREGWLQPWVRIASTEEHERTRLAAMPAFQTLNLAQTIKPGASVLATVKSSTGTELPALIVQPFGKGRVGALMVGDWWRWHMQSSVENDDMMKSWRQMVRWLVSDVPRRVEAEVLRDSEAAQSVRLVVDVRDESFRPLDNAQVAISVLTPDNKTVQMVASAVDAQAGRYVADFASQQSGAFRAEIIAKAADQSLIEQREIGWVADPDAAEFRSLVPDRKSLERLAEKTGGEVIDQAGLNAFVESLDDRKVPITVTQLIPWWHRWMVMALAMSLLVTEWGFRRWKGWP